nr:hypothetical protein [Amylibacter sp.]
MDVAERWLQRKFLWQMIQASRFYPVSLFYSCGEEGLLAVVLLQAAEQDFTISPICVARDWGSAKVRPVWWIAKVFCHGLAV